MMGYGMSMGWWGWLMMAGFWLVLIVAAVWVVRLLFPPSTVSGREVSREEAELRSAEEILKIRYARGELSEEQYQHMRQTIRQ